MVFVTMSYVGKEKSFHAHEECYQMSGDDNGYIERANKTIEEHFNEEPNNWL